MICCALWPQLSKYSFKFIAVKGYPMPHPLQGREYISIYHHIVYGGSGHVVLVLQGRREDSVLPHVRDPDQVLTHTAAGQQQQHPASIFI